MDGASKRATDLAHAIAGRFVSGDVTENDMTVVAEKIDALVSEAVSARDAEIVIELEARRDFARIAETVRLKRAGRLSEIEYLLGFIQPAKEQP